jgi:peptidoglycan/LPS O-acetylase OafA/YrhL
MSAVRVRATCSIGGAGLLALSLYLPWYTTGGPRPGSVTGWVALHRLDVVLAAVAVATLALITLRSRPWLTLAQGGLAVVALVVVCWRVLRLPALPHVSGAPVMEVTGVDWGALVALAGALAMLAGTRPAGRHTDDEAPERAASVSQAGELRSARIESLRALAALSVLGYHSLLYSKQLHPPTSAVNQVILGGASGVFFFFALSGYLLFWPFIQAALGTGRRISLRRYALNRALRILPLYYALITLLLLLHQNGSSPGQLWRFALFAENFSFSSLYRADAPMWSLVVEVHFYVLLPLIGWLVAAIARGSARRAGFVVGALGAAGLVARIVIVETKAVPPVFLTLAIPTLFFFFAAGMLLAVLRAAWQDSPPRWLRGPLRSPDAWILASAPLWVLTVWRHQLEVLVAPAAFLVMGACVLPLGHGRLTRALEWRPLALLGLASYSLYLWHSPILAWIAGGHLAYPHGAPIYTGPVTEFPRLLLMGLAASIPVAGLSYRYIESPFLRLRGRWTSPGRRGGDVPAAMPQVAPTADAVNPG